MADSAVLATASSVVNPKVSTIMGPSELSATELKSLVKDHLYAAMSTVIDDIDSILGSTRMKPYVASGVTSPEKTTLGITLLPDDIYNAYKRAGSAVMHNGSIENVWYHNGNIYKISAKADFEAANSLVHTRMAYLYINANGSAGEATTALGNYTTELGTLS